MAHHVYDPVLERQTMKDDLVPGHLGRGPFIIDDEDDEDGKRSWEDVAELAQHHSDQRWSVVWKAGMHVRVVDDELEPEIRCVGWMAVKDNVASVDILAHAVPSTLLAWVTALCRGSSAFYPHVQSDRTDPGSEAVFDIKPEADRVAAQEVFAPGRVETSIEMCSPV